MKLKRLYIASFRNLEEVNLEPAGRFNILHGNNAQGKTNILEAIYLLGTMKSFRHARNIDLVSWGTDTGVISGVVEKEGVDRSIAVIITREGKRVRVDQKSVTRLADFFGNLNVVIFSPEELAMVKGAPETRRRYLDRAIFNCDETYLDSYHEYMKILRHRNSLLKGGDRTGLDVWSEKLAGAGAALLHKRLRYIEEVAPLLEDFYRDITGNDETAALAYHPYQMSGKDLEQETAAKLLAALEKTAAEEVRYGTTVVGPHRDDIIFFVNGKKAKVHASQGQQRSYVLALKMAEIEYVERKFLHPPVLLLDDISSELDRNRNRNLMEFLKHKEMQVFISTTGLTTLALEGIAHYSTFSVEKGNVLH